MNVFTHSCEEDGVFRSYFIPLEDHCEEETEEVLPPCCQKAKASSCDQSVLEKDCCNDEVDVFKINLDYFSEYQVEVPNLFFVENAFKFEIPQLDLALSCYNPEKYTHPPPKWSGRDILILHQVFRI